MDPTERGGKRNGSGRVTSSESVSPNLNPLYTGGLFHCYMLDESICPFRGVWSILSLFSMFLWKILLANTVDPDQMPHYVASDLGLQCLPMTLLWFPVKNGLYETSDEYCAAKC